MAAQTRKHYIITYEFLNVICTFETVFIEKLCEKLDTIVDADHVHKRSINITTVEK
jgi:hypothetical protein